MNDQGELAAPTIYNGVMYVINGKWTFAIDVETGTTDLAHAGGARTGYAGRPRSSRGAATIYNGKVFRVTIDNHVLALDMKTGKQVWNQKFAEPTEGYYATSAPIVANGVLISGMAGGESTTRGFLDGWDPDTGKKLVAALHHSRARRARARRRGPRTATRGCTAAGRRGAPVPTIRSSIWCYWGTGNAEPLRSQAARGLGQSRSPSSVLAHPAQDRRNRSATSNTHRTTSTTWTAPTNTCSRTSRSAASRAR